MRSPTNRIMSAIAFAELISVSCYFLITLQTVAHGKPSRGPVNTHAGGVFNIFLNLTFMQTHSMSAWLTVILALWRYVVVRYPLKSTTWCTMRKANTAIFVTYTIVAVMFIPVYFLLILIPNVHIKGVKQVVQYDVSSFFL